MRVGPVLRAITYRGTNRWRRAWGMGIATFCYTWRHPLPDGGRIGFWFALHAAYENFVGYWRSP